MADGFDPSEPTGNAPITSDTGGGGGILDWLSGALGAVGTGAGDALGGLGTWLSNPANMSLLTGAIGGLAPGLGALLSGGNMGGVNTTGTANTQTTNQNIGLSQQDQNFMNLMNSLQSGTNFQNQTQNQTGMNTTNQNMTGGMNQSQSGGFNQAQNTGFNQAQTGGMNQSQTGGFNNAQTGGFGQQQTGGMTSATTGGMNQAQTGGQTGRQVQTLNTQMTPTMAPEAAAAGQQISGALTGQLPTAQNLWGQGANLMQQLLPQAQNLLKGMGGPGAIPIPTMDLIKQAFEPMVGDIADQAITAARNRGFGGGADLLGGAASPLAGRALANIPGQEAAAYIQASQQVPWLNAQIQNMQNQGLLQALQGGAAFGQQMMNPAQTTIGQNLGLMNAYPVGQSQTGTNTTDTSGTNFSNTSGTNFGNTTGTNFGNTSGTNFSNASGTNFGNTTGTNFQNASGTGFGNTSGTNFGNTTGTNFQDTNSQSLQNMINNMSGTGGFTNTGQQMNTGTQSNTGQTANFGAGTQNTQSNQLQTQTQPLGSLIGTTVAGGLGGLSGANQTNLSNTQNAAFLNTLAGMMGKSGATNV
jgi:hypothetical protein